MGPTLPVASTIHTLAHDSSEVGSGFTAISVTAKKEEKGNKERG